MDENLIIALEDAGLSRNEGAVYLALLEIGSSTATQITKLSKLHRTNVYDSLERLLKKGLVSYVTKGDTKYFQANNPESLLSLVRQKEDKLKDIIPRLKLADGLAESKDSVKILEGVQGIRAITEDILVVVPVGGEVLTFGNPRNTSELMKSFIDFYHKRRIAKKISQIHIYNENAKERIKYLDNMAYTRAAYLPKEYDSPAATTIYGDKVAFYIWSEPPLGILIESKRMADSYRNYFRLLWKIASGSKEK